MAFILFGYPFPNNKYLLVDTITGATFLYRRMGRQIFVKCDGCHQRIYHPLSDSPGNHDNAKNSRRLNIISNFINHNAFSQMTNNLIRSVYNDVIMNAMASWITSLTIVYSTVYSGTDQRKHQSSASLTSVRGINQWPVNSPHIRPVTRKMFPFDDVIIWKRRGG